eukprot:m.678930 g.678930  ORF g.678930 m.678930 type:complete len:66 (-) comp22809_c0_seq14:763-960(-)
MPRWHECGGTTLGEQDQLLVSQDARKRVACAVPFCCHPADGSPELWEPPTASGRTAEISAVMAFR